MKRPPTPLVVSIMILSLGMALPAPVSLPGEQNVLALGRRAQLSVFALPDSSLSSKCLSPEVISVRNAVGQIKFATQGIPLSILDLQRELELSFPDSVRLGPGAVTYVWRLIDGEWVLFCLVDDTLSVDLEGVRVAVQQRSEMSI